MNRRGFVLSSLVMMAARAARAQSLPIAPPSPKPFALFTRARQRCETGDLHHVYLPDQDRWEAVASMPTARSAHGLVVHRDRLFAMGREGNILVNGKPSPKEM